MMDLGLCSFRSFDASFCGANSLLRDWYSPILPCSVVRTTNYLSLINRGMVGSLDICNSLDTILRCWEFSFISEETGFIWSKFIFLLFVPIRSSVRRGSSVHTDWTFQSFKHGGGKIFQTGPPNILYNGYQVFTGGKAVGGWRWPRTLI